MATRRPSTALVVDVDGVVSPVGGRTAWGDDVVAGVVFSPVLVSPTLCRRLDRLAQEPDVVALWLTSWPDHMRAAMSPFPGRTWPEITSQPTDPDLGWWKWDALAPWLDDHSWIQRLAWCDDHLTDDHLTELGPPGDRPAPGGRRNEDELYGLEVIHAELSRRELDYLLFAPRTAIGVTPRHVKRLERFVAKTRRRRTPDGPRQMR